MLKKGTDQEVVQYSKKLMQNFAQKRKVFKGNSTKDVFKNYADYSMYKSNYAKLDDRNYEHLDRLDRDKVASSAYEFIDNLPDDYS